MNKQTHSEETLKRTKGIIGDEDKLKSSTENPEKRTKYFSKKSKLTLRSAILTYFFMKEIYGEEKVMKEVKSFINYLENLTH